MKVLLWSIFLLGLGFVLGNSLNDHANDAWRMAYYAARRRDAEILGEKLVQEMERCRP